MHLIFALLLLPFGAIHFLPTIIAALRDHRNVIGVFLLNLFLGWTVIGWIVALIWAAAGDQKWRYYGYAQPVRRF